MATHIHFHDDQPRDEGGRFAAIAATARKHGFTKPHAGGLANKRGETIHAKRATGEWTHTHHEGGYGQGKKTGTGPEELDQHLKLHNEKQATAQKRHNALLRAAGHGMGHSPRGWSPNR